MAWLTGWGRRKSKNIAGSTAGAQANYQMLKIRVHKDTGTDTASGANGTLQHVYVGINVRDDFGDVTFTKADETTPLDFWMETYVSGDYADFYVEVDSIPESPDTVDIYVYYDKSDETTGSDFETTMTQLAIDANTKALYHFDNNIEDETGNYDGTNNGMTFETDKGTVGTHSIHGLKDTAGSDASFPSLVNGATQGTIEFWLKVSETATPSYSSIFGSNDASAHGFAVLLWADGTLAFTADTGAAWLSPTTTDFDDGEWHHVAATWHNVDGRVVYIDGLSELSDSRTANAVERGTNYMNRDGTSADRDANIYVDEMRFSTIARGADEIKCDAEHRKFADPEPSWGAFGSEETPPTVGQPTQLRTRLIPGMNYIGVPV